VASRVREEVSVDSEEAGELGKWPRGGGNTPASRVKGFIPIKSSHNRGFKPVRVALK
jgi:hypothetical protein